MYQIFKMVFLSVLLMFHAFTVAHAKEHSHNFSKSISEFHDVLSPLWHMAPSENRKQETCKNIPKMIKKARMIKDNDPEKLVLSLKSMSSLCESSLEQFDLAFANVHSAFHHVANIKEDKEHSHE